MFFYFYSRQSLIDHITVQIAPRAADEIWFGENQVIEGVPYLIFLFGRTHLLKGTNPLLLVLLSFYMIYYRK